MSVIFLFIDGVGLGREDDTNPFYQSNYRGFIAMSGGKYFTKQSGEIKEENHVFRHVDATLGVDGLPQSGTGQTALFSGKNASEKIGKHFGPFPHSEIKYLLKEDSLFNKAQKLDKSCQFMNAYPEIFFERARQRNRWSCTTLMTKSAEIPLNMVKEVKMEKALTAEITQQVWREHLNIDVPEITPEEAADRLMAQSEHYDLLLYEYYLTDKAGHSQERDRASRFLETYDRFLWHLINNKQQQLTLVLCSDHGNIEDLSIKTHTLNKVPLYACGPGADQLAEGRSIMDVTPGILRMLDSFD